MMAIKQGVCSKCKGKHQKAMRIKMEHIKKNRTKLLDMKKYQIKNNAIQSCINRLDATE